MEDLEAENIVALEGELIGERAPTDPAIAREEVVHVTAAHAGGPAENSMVMVTVDRRDVQRARYISWIGYADLDHANTKEFGRWKLLDPPSPYRTQVRWRPFGWGALEEVWTRSPSEAHPASEHARAEEGAP